MSRLEHNRLVRMLSTPGKKFMPYFPLGYPDLERSKAAIRSLIACGADALEIGIPFSDPLADGPILHRAATSALANGVGIFQAIRFVRELREEGVELPLLLMGYLNPFSAYRYERLFEDVTRAGVDGIIIPDLPLEHRRELVPQARARNLVIPSFVAPTSTEERLCAIAEQAEGFFYAMAVSGTTGDKVGGSGSIEQVITTLRKYSSLPVVIGFGIKNSEDAVRAARFGDAIIVGSALLEQYDRGVDQFVSLASSISQVLHS